MTMDVAQTNVQLYNQIRLQKYTDEDLQLVRRAYDLAKRLYSGYYQADGVPFVAHVVGVASLMARLDLASDWVAAACLHNVYTNGDFGEGYRHCAANHRRRLLVEAVGEKVESHVFRFFDWLRRPPGDVLRYAEGVDKLDTQERMLLVMHLADLLEKCHACGPLYYGDHRWVTEVVDRDGAKYVDLAERLGYPALASALSNAFKTLLAASIPASLRPTHDRQKYMRLEMPPSCTRRPTVKGRRALHRIGRRVRRAWSSA
ncbi:MAG: HD domain-containing protein [Gammaproteobacteria bacterium]|nr:HD domain-containing protein [Gammaproteobacteria bacterium]